MFALKYEDELDEPVARELQSILIQLKAFLLSEHNEDGTHRGSAITSATDPDNAEPNPTSETGKVSDATRHWKSPGPWLFDDRNATNPNSVGLRVSIPTGTYNDYAPTGINDAVILDIEPTGGTVTLNGLRQHLGIARNKRMLLIRNSSATQSLTLKHSNTGSSTGSRFFLPANTDVTMGPGQNIWLYYDPAKDGWTAAITPHAAGGIGTGAASTNVLLDGANHTDTVAQTVSRGSLIYGNSTPKWDELTIGAANRFLKSDGTDASWAQVDLTAAVTGVLPIANGGAISQIAWIRRVVTENELEAIGTTSLSIVPASGSSSIDWVLYAAFELDVTAVYTTSPTLRLVYGGTSTTQLSFASMSFTTTGKKATADVSPVHTHIYSTFDPRNRGIDLDGTANPGNGGGTGHCSGVLTVLYVTVAVA